MTESNHDGSREDALIRAAFAQEQRDSGSDNPLAQGATIVPPDLQRAVSTHGPKGAGKDTTEAIVRTPPTDTSPQGKATRALPQIDGYRLLGVLGEGGMSIVYRAVQLKLDRVVALKVLPAVVANANPSTVARFRREATAAARFHHTHIVPIYDFGECHDGYYYAMELVSGQPLSVLVRRLAQENVVSASPVRLAEILRSATTGQQMTTKDSSDDSAGSSSGGSTGTSTLGRGRAYYLQVARWMADAADALEYAHGQGVIHRDIKPSNVLLSTDGRIMITDFGLAKVAGDGSVTMTGSLVGTLRYMSPEQAMAKRMKLDHRTDLYSFGATMYELLCFQPAFPGSDEKEILGAIITRDPVAPRKIVATVPHELETICLSLLEKSPDARYATARALGEDIRRYISDMPIIKKRPGPVHRVRKFIRRHKGGVIAGLSIIGFVTTILLASHFVKRERIQRLLGDATTFYTRNDWAAAAEVYQQVLLRDSRNIEALGNLARMKKEMFNEQHAAGQSDKQLLVDALALCDEALDVQPTEETVLNNKGVILKILGRYGEAINAYKQVIDLHPDFSAAWENLGVVYALDKNLDAAIENLRKAVDLCDPKKERQCEYPWRNLAAVQLQLGTKAASDSVRKAADLSPHQLATERLHVKLLLELDGSNTASERILEAAIYADSLADEKDPIVKRLRALACLAHGDLENAGRFARAAIELGDRLAAADYLIVAVAEGPAGRADTACEALAQAQESWPAKLLNPDDYEVTADVGILWFESAEHLFKLKKQAERICSSQKVEGK